MDKTHKDKSDKARERILSRLKGACENTNGLTPDASWSVRVFPQPMNLLETFIEEFKKVSGHVFVCEDTMELAQTLDELRAKNAWKYIFCVDDELKTMLNGNFPLIDKSDFVNVEVSITRCEYLIARSGSVLVSSAQQSGRRANVFPPIHVVIARQNQLVPFLEDAIHQFKEKYSEDLPSQATVITGPSRTADIEKTLVMGAHGPKELFVLIHK
ncbi:lactate utilization protein [Carboxylicivirga sp. A043]|uniref:LutC/YkgG family protein n=1 Tax=Carboxylicivirga litoralis TaxID=2816963 RepID=UPI0021CB593A|nr:lactate utilization protein [Carboxylicivirga sp. A043]MCU4155263.1 lactate utilization protein [Carboxylicivirga sp. A043]